MAVRTEKSADATAIRPFTIEIPEAEIEELRRASRRRAGPRRRPCR